MSLSVAQLTEEALTLPEQARANLARTLLESLDPLTVREDVEAAWEEEIQRRVAKVRDGTATGRPADEVFRDIRKRYLQ
jgi:putative addiction module component (TIGR02574 family)